MKYCSITYATCTNNHRHLTVKLVVYSV